MAVAGKHCKMKNYYMVLCIESFAEINKVKESYTTLAKTWHPDKCTEENLVHLHDCGLEKKPTNISEYFHVLIEAWNVLKDPNVKKVYDEQLKQHLLESQLFISDEIGLYDMRFDPDCNEMIYGCRCGGVFSVDKTDINGLQDCTSDFIIQCDNCSLYIRVLLSDNDES